MAAARADGYACYALTIDYGQRTASVKGFGEAGVDDPLRRR